MKISSVNHHRSIRPDDINSMQITDEYIDVLVEEFYSRVREDEILGSVFLKAIGNDWAEHLNRMKDFWSSLVLNTKRYSGNPMQLHKNLDSVKKSHFVTWLALFRETLEATAPTIEVVDFFMLRAERIALNLQMGVFGIQKPVSKQ